MYNLFVIYFMFFSQLFKNKSIYEASALGSRHPVVFKDEWDTAFVLKDFVIEWQK